MVSLSYGGCCVTGLWIVGLQSAERATVAESTRPLTIVDAVRVMAVWEKHSGEAVKELQHPQQRVETHRHAAGQ